MLKLLLVAAGGAVGSTLRYLVSGVAQQAARDSAFPAGTLVVNLAGCLALGVLAELAEARGVLAAETRAFLFVGVIGGFTTFSAFANETWNAVRDGQTALAAVNVALQVLLGLAAVWAGRALAHRIWG